MLTGLDIEAKADVGARAARRPSTRTWTLARTDHPDADVQEEAAALLHCVVRGPDPKALGRAFSGAAIELALASYPGFHVTAPPGDASPVRRVHRRLRRRPAQVPHVAVLADGTRVDIAPADRHAGARPTSPRRPLPAGAAAGPTRRVPLGTVVGARSGDKGGAANVGVWARSDDAFAWLARLPRPSTGSSELLPETARAARHPARAAQPARAELRRRGLLGEGVASQRPARPAGQGARRMAALARRRRSRQALLVSRSRSRRPSARRCARPCAASCSATCCRTWTNGSATGELPRSLHERGGRARAARPAYPASGRRRRRRRDRRARAGRGVALRRRRPAGVFASLFTSGISLPHLVAAGDPRPDRALGAPDDRRAR